MNGGSRGWWDPDGDGLCCVEAHNATGAASLATSYLDLTGNGNDLTLGTAPTWAAGTGWTFNGVNQVLWSPWVGEDDQSQSALVQYTNAPGVAPDGLFGVINNAILAHGIALAADTGVAVSYYNGIPTAVGPAMVAGNLAFAGAAGYRDGVLDGAIGAVVGHPVNPIAVGAIWDVGGAVSLFFGGDIQAIAFYDCALTAPQVLAIATAMALL